MFSNLRDLIEHGRTQDALLEARTIVEMAMEGISKLDEAGRYVFVNAEYAALLGYRPEELLGQSWEVTVPPEERAAVSPIFEQMLATGRGEGEIRGVKKDGSLIYKHVVIIKPDTAHGRMPGHYCFARDVTERRVAQDRERGSQRLLSAIMRVQSLFIDEATSEAVWEVMLEELLQLTSSEYGFIGEVARTEEGLPFLRTYAITNIAWNDETLALLARLAPTLEFRNLKSLFGHVMTSGRPVIANDAAHDPRAGELPPGHPPMHAFLGIPFFHGETLTGMVGIANRPGGYDEALVADLQPFLATCSQLVEGFRNKRQRNEAEEALRQSEERWQLAAKGTNDGMWDWNIVTKKVFYSTRWAEMRGYAAHEVTDTEEIWRNSIHPDDLTHVMERLTAYFAKQSPEFREEYRVRRKDGSYMWILDRGLAVWDEQGRPIRMAGSDSDITERKQAEALQAAEKQVLELVARGQALNDVLAALCRMIETNTVPMLCSVMLANQEGTRLSSAAAPSLPEEYNRQVDGIPIGPTTGSCGSAAYSGRPTIVTDISTDPLWTDYAHTALAHGLKACWSHPIVSSTGTMLGTFAAYYRESREPKPHDLRVVERASHIAAVAIEHATVVNALRESEARFHAFMSYSPTVKFIKDEAGRHLYVNPQFEKLFGVSGDAVKEKTVFDFLPREIATRLHENDQLVFASGEVLQVEETVPDSDGKLRYWLVIKFPIETRQGRLLGGTAIEITARKQAEAARETLQYAVEHGMEGFALLDSDGRYTYMNEAHARIYGFQVSELIGRSWKTLYDADLIATIETTILPILRAEGTWRGELVGRMSGGLPVQVEVGLQRLPHNAVLPDVFLCTCRDITMRKRVEERLQRTQFAMDQAVDAVYWINPQARILYTNEAARTMLGYTGDEFLRMTVHDLNPNFPPEVWPQWWAEVRDKKVMSLESVHLSKEGRRIPIDIRVSFLAYGGQEFHCAFVRDISKRKEAEEAAYRSFSLLQSVLHTTPIRVFWKDRASRYLGCNQQFALDSGYPDAKEIVGKTDDDLVWNRQAALYQADDRQVMESGQAKLDFDEPGTTREGQPSWLRTSKVPLRDEQGHVIGVLGVYEDVTERKRMEVALDALARGTGAVIGHEFFPRFVQELAQALQVRCAGICDHFQERPGYAKVRAMWNGGAFVPSFEYALAPTPCGQVVREGFAYVPSSVRELFPEDADLVALRAESYLGFLLRSGSGEPMGHIFMIDDKPLAESKQATAIMQIFGARAAAELERIRADDALRASQERFELAVRASNDGIWDWNIPIGEQYWSDRHFELFGLEPSTRTPTYDTWISLVHPEDVDHVHQATRRHLDTREPYDIEVRVRMKDGTYRWFRDQGQALWDSTGRPVRMVGSISDVTERKEAHAQLEQHVADRTAALRRSEQRYAALVNSVDGIIMEVDVEAAGITFVSEQAERIVGYPVRSWMDEPSFFQDHLHPDDRDRVLTYCADMTKQGLNHEMEYRMLNREGRIVWIRDLVTLMHADDGTVKLCCILMDVTKQKEIGNRLQLTQFTVDRAAQGIFWVGSNAEILYVNEAACNVLGYGRAELLNMTVHDIDPNFPPEIWPTHWKELKQRGSFTFESSQLTKDGQVRYTEITVNYLEYDGREYNCANVRDVTDRKLNEVALSESEERFSKAFNESAIGMAIVALDGRWLQVNQALCEIVGYSKAELYASTFQAITHPDDLDANLRYMQQVLSGVLRTYQMEKRYFHKNGSIIWIVLNVSLVRNVDGTPKHFISQIQDISERKQIEDRLRATQYAVDHAADQIFVIGPSGNFLDVNEAACRRLGYAKQELLTMSVMDIDPDYPREVWPQHWAEFRQTGQLRFETRHCTKSGEIYPVEITANYHVHKGQELEYAIVRDLTERRQAEAAIRDSELRYKLLTEATFDGIAIHDQGTLLEVNAGLERMFGYEPGELVGRSLWDLIADESRDLVLANIKKGVLGPYEAIGRRKDGTTFPGEVVVRLYQYRGKEVRLVAGRDITERKYLEQERLRRTEDLERQIATRTDEIAKLESQRAQTERLAALGRLAAGVAHEINNPIAGIKNAFTLVKQAVDPAHPQHEFVDMIDREIDRVSSIVQNMYQLYGRESGKSETVDLRTMIEDIKALFAAQLQQRQLTLAVETVEAGLWRLDVSRRDLLQVLLNLLNNAIDCSREKTLIRLIIREEADVIRIAVVDQGAGISPEILPHIFDPFFTTKTEGDQKGMGLGLSISQSLVMAMGGKIEVHTQPGHGSTVSVLLPRDKIVAQVPDEIHPNKEVMTYGG